MHTEPVLILLVEDDQAHIEAVSRSLAAADERYEIEVVVTLADCRQALERRTPHLVLTDLNLPDGQALDLLTSPPGALAYPLLVMTSSGDEGMAVQVIKAGALDYVVKSAHLFKEMPHIIKRARREWELIQARLRADVALRESEAKQRRIIETAQEGIWEMDSNHKTTFVNQMMADMLGFSRDEMIGRPVTDFIFAEDLEEHWQQMGERREGKPGWYERRFMRKDGGEIWMLVSATAAQAENGVFAGSFGMFTDITERKQLEDERKLTVQLLGMLNSGNDLHALVKDVTALLHDWSGCEAVGVRLREGDDFPYFETRGFPAQFVQLEKYLCARDLQGDLIRDATGNPVLECMCGNILCGRINPNQPFFTSRGSFWSNCTSELLANTSEADRQARTRNRCNGEGYESVALIPLRAGGTILGLLQLNDHRRDRFTAEKIALYERLGENLGIALEQRQSQAALKESEEKFRKAFTASLDAISLTRLQDGVYVSINKGFTSILGYEEKEVLGRMPYELGIWYDPAERDKAVEILKQAGEIRDYETLFRTKNGRLVNALTSAALVNLGGETYILGSTRDISERVRAEERIHFQANLLDVVEHAVIVIDVTLKVIFWNLFAEKLYGWRREEALGKTLDELIVPEMSQEQAAEILQHLQAGKAWSGEFLVQRKNEKKLTIFVTDSPVVDQKGELIGFVGVSHDISEDKQAEKALRESEERYRLLYQSGGIGVGYYTTDARVISYNEIALQHMGMREADVVGKSVYELFPKEDGDIYADRMASTIRQGGTLEFEDEVVLPPGNKWFLSVYSCVKDLKGGILGIQIMSVDISERKQADIQVEAARTALQTLASRQEAILLAVPEIIMEVDTDKVYTWANQRGYEFFGEDVIGKNAESYFLGEQDTYQLVQPLFEGAEDMVYVESWQRRKDGQKRLLAWWCRTHRDENGNITGALSSARDITDQKAAEDVQLAVYKIAQAANQTEDLAQLYAGVHTILKEIMSAENFYISLHDADQDLLQFPYFVDEVDQDNGAIKAGKGLTEYVLHSGETLLCDEALMAALIRNGEVEAVGPPSPIWLGVPLKMENKTFGVMVVQHYSEAAALGEREKQIFEYVAQQVATAISRKLAEAQKEAARAELERSESVLQKIFDTLPVGLWFADKHGQLLRGNPMGVKIWGGEPKVGLPEYGVFKARWLPSRVEIPPDGWALAHTVREGITIIDELLEIDALDGTKKIILNSTAPVLDDEGNVQGAIVVNQDITDRVKAEGALRESEEKFRTMADQMADVLYVTDKNGVITYLSPSAKAVFGWSIEEMSGRHFAQLLEEKEIPRAMDAFMSAVTTGKPTHNLELRMKRKDGRVFMGELGSTVLWRDGEVESVMGLIRDISERQEMMEKVLRAQKMADLGTLAAGVAHEINSPLQVVTGSSEVLLNKLKEENLDREGALRRVERINQNGWRIAKIVRSLLDYARSTQEDLTVTSLNGIVNDTLLLVEHQIHVWSNVKVVTELAENLPDFVCDRNKIIQVLINLMTNARDAMPHGGMVAIHTSYEPEKERLVLMVRDSGQGIPDALRARIFDPFFTTKPLGQGTGLGLSIVQGIVNAHGGEISVDSQPGNGTTFTLLLPLAPPPDGELSDGVKGRFGD